MLYFAYGSNLRHAQMKRRCPDSQFLFSAVLENYKFVYKGYADKWEGAVGNIIKAPEEIVWGGVYEINQTDLESLDSYEHYPKIYDRAEFNVQDREGNLHKVITYFKKNEPSGQPSDRYRQTIVQGARDCGLSEGYIQNILN